MPDCPPSAVLSFVTEGVTDCVRFASGPFFGVGWDYGGFDHFYKEIGVFLKGKNRVLVSVLLPYPQPAFVEGSKSMTYGKQGQPDAICFQ